MGNKYHEITHYKLFFIGVHEIASSFLLAMTVKCGASPSRLWRNGKYPLVAPLLRAIAKQSYE